MLRYDTPLMADARSLWHRLSTGGLALLRNPAELRAELLWFKRKLAVHQVNGRNDLNLRLGLTPLARKGRRFKRIFVIGLAKTGTSTAGTALRMLGLRAIGPLFIRDEQAVAELQRADYRRLEHHVESYDALCNSPAVDLYKHLDARYPGSLFILTVRSVERWFPSYCRYFEGRPESPMRRWLVGPGCNHDLIDRRDAIIAHYWKHHDGVIEHFRDRRDDLLVWDVAAAPSWEPLCGFLRIPAPQHPFPHIIPERSGGYADTQRT